jgi:hypothetical protein
MADATLVNHPADGTIATPTLQDSPASDCTCEMNRPLDEAILRERLGDSLDVNRKKTPTIDAHHQGVVTDRT